MTTRRNSRGEEEEEDEEEGNLDSMMMESFEVEETPNSAFFLPKRDGFCHSRMRLVVGVTLAVVVAVALVVVIIELNKRDSTKNTNNNNNNTAPFKPSPQQAKFYAELAQVVLADMNRSVDPCQDFYQYSCGGWLSRTQLPPDKPYYARSFSTIYDSNLQSLREILEEGWPLLSTFYRDCMDNGTREERGWRPIQPWLARVDALKNASELAILLAELHVIGVRAAFSFYVEPDARQPNMNIAVIDQGGMGLPSTEYYLSSAPNLQNLREAYKHHIRDSLSMVNISQSSAEQQSQLAFEMEHKLALISFSPLERRDAEKTYNKRTMRALKTNLTPNFEWTTYFHALNKAIKNETMREEVFDTAKDESQSVNVVVLKFMEGLQPLFAVAETTTLMEQWKAYLRWRIVDDTSTLLSERFQAKAFNFSKHLYGSHLQRSEQWKTCTKATQNSLGFLLGRYFVQRYFSPDSKELATELIHDLQAGAFRQSIDQLSWMDGRTKQKALQKLDAIMHKIGYPSEWPTYEELLVAPRRYFESAIDARRLDNAQVLRSAYKPVSKSEWVMHPQEVNAYYRPDWNEIVFPAGILQPPFFYSPSLSSSPPSFTNYGGIGMVIGHELTHGFDDQGRRYDASGNLTDWWTEATSQQFQQRASCVSQYYSQNFAIELLIKASSSGSEEGEETFVKSKLHVNGELTLGENIADIGGLKQAFLAWKTHNEDIKHKKQLEEEQHLTKQYFDGLDAAKLFFVSFAQNWCAVYSGEYLHTLVTTNPHSPNEFRVKGPVSHNKYFAEAFGCAANAPMNPKNKCDIW